MTVYYNDPLSGGGGTAVAFYSTFADLPLVGILGELALTLDTSVLYAWDGIAWIPAVSPSAVTGNLTESISDVLIIGNGTNAVLGSGTTIDVQKSTSTQDGYLSSVDWNTFNSKQPAGAYITALSGDLSATGPGSVAGTLATVNSNIGSFTNASLTVNAKGLVTAASSGTAPVTSVNGSGGGSISVNAINQLTGDITTNSAVGSQSEAATLATVNANIGSFTYGSFTVNAKGLITAASSSTPPLTSLTGDVTTSTSGAASATLATVNSNVGSFTNASLTVNAKGLITAASSGTAPVTSVSLTDSTGLFNITGSPGTGVASLTLSSLNSQTANEVLASPNGSSGAPSFRSLVVADVPNGNLTETTSSVLTISGGTHAVLGSGTTIAVSQATTSTAGYVSSTDWNTFNGKQPAGSYITALTGGITASGPGSVSATVNNVGGSTAAAVNTATVAANNATSTNTPNTIVLRDGSGNFAAGTITANLVGTTPAGTVTVTGGTAASGGVGGQATIAGGSGSGTGSGGNGGALNLNGGNANGDNTVNQSGGTVNISGGNSKGGAQGGGITLSCGNGGVGTGTAGATGGTVNINGGLGGVGSATSGNGGNATVKAGSGGNGVSAGQGGTAQLVGGTGGTGSSSRGTGGPANVTGGSPGSFAGAQGGSVTISSAGGSNTGNGGAGGTVTISTGQANGDNSANYSGGSLTLSVGRSVGSSGGSNINITAGLGGVGTSTTGANGGTTNLNAGNGGVGSATGGTGGNVVISAGTGGNSSTPGAGGAILFQTGPTIAVVEHFRISNAGNALVTSGMMQVGTAGFGLAVKSGPNCKLGIATLAAGTVTVANTSITSNSTIFLTSQADGGTPGWLRVTAKTVGTSFVITSSSNTDTSNVGWFIVEQM